MSAYDFLGLLYIFIVLLCILLSPAPTWYTFMAIILLTVPLNTKQTISIITREHFYGSATPHLKVRDPSSPQFWGSFIRTPFVAEQIWRNPYRYGVVFVFRCQLSSHRMGWGPSAPNFGVSIYAYTLNCRTTKFDVATMWGMCQPCFLPATPRVEFQGSQFGGSVLL